MLITRKIYLNSRYLNSDIYTFLLKELNDKMKQECTSEYGYILHINKIVRVIDGFNVSSINCDIICDVEFDAETLKPRLGDEHEGRVCVILPKVGILIEVKNCLKVLVKENSLIDYTYDNMSNTFSHKKCKTKDIRVGDTIRVKLTGVKYTDRKFCCFGDFIEI